MYQTSSKRLLREQLRAGFHTTVLLFAMSGILGVVGWLLGGVPGVVWSVVLGTAALCLSPRVSPRVFLRMQAARELDAVSAPEIHSVFRRVHSKSDLENIPRLYYLPHPGMNAFAVGGRKNAAVAVTHGLLNKLSADELEAVLAHELSHIVNNDVALFAFAEVIRRLTQVLSVLGVFFLCVQSALFTESDRMTWLPIAVLLVGPVLSAILQLALSRSREFAADLQAARMTGNPVSLATALQKLDGVAGSFVISFFFPSGRRPESILRTHPAIHERTCRLRKLTGESSHVRSVGSRWSEPAAGLAAR